MNILLIGPNGSGKSALAGSLKKYYSIPHIEVGSIFQKNIRKGTNLGQKAREYIDLGELVPDEITIPMIMDRIQREKYHGWVLDGFPRTKDQAVTFEEALSASFEIDIVFELYLDYPTAERRIMGRRTCIKDRTHANNVNIEALKPKDGACRICGGKLKERTDDNPKIIKRRHEVYCDPVNGTLAAACYLKSIAQMTDKFKFVNIDATPSLDVVSEALLSEV